ncbi:MAG: DUF2309 domain-containing protein [Cytophagales bacterium]|nr:DUF2309 domain-containing protein [Cytophagales bacterium]
MLSVQTEPNISQVRKSLRPTVNKMAPLWSLENFVAVNPYLGMAEMNFANAMDFLNKSSHVNATLPIQFYLKALDSGEMRKEDVAEALKENRFGIFENADEFIESVRDGAANTPDYQVHTLVDVASEINGKKWRRFMIDRISFWAGAYFDDQQATWNTASRETSLFAAWKQEAEIDFSTEAMGLKGFRQFIKNLPTDHLKAATRALQQLEIPDSMLDYYLHGLMMKMNGWAGFAARIDWDAALQGSESHAVEEFLAILLVWEMALKELLPYPHLNASWILAKEEAKARLQSDEISDSMARQVLLQKAFDHANQRKIIQKINNQKAPINLRRDIKVQAAFCIDVRSELYRRNLEVADDAIETIGFAGFFGFPIEYVPLAHDHGINQCPVLLNTSHTVKEQLDNPDKEKAAIKQRTFSAQIRKAWKAFKSGAVSCFGFVSPLGLYFLPKLLTDSFGLTRPQPYPDHVGLSTNAINGKKVNLSGMSDSATGIPLEDRVNMAHSALKAMSLTEGFAPIVMIVGHGSSTVNNPHGTGLDCGACGGHTGEANARVATAVLNDSEVRSALKSRGVEIPENTQFFPALHDTTTDEVNLLFPSEEIPASHTKEIADLRLSLKVASESARKERAARMNITSGDVSKQIIQRSKDWSQVRPEWGLAGCSSFIVAPRARTAQLNFGGKAFMHNYAWRKDEGFGILEVIMTAPMVVTSWINLQYYASTVDNKKFGAGNKTLHNVVGGLGVLEGSAGDLRTGLPMQSVHDGEKYQHEPQRLNVIIEAPIDEMSKILAKHDSIRNLVDNQWIYLFAINDTGKVTYRYIGDLEWELIA